MNTRFTSPLAHLAFSLLCVIWMLPASTQAQDRGLDLDTHQPAPGQYYALVIGNNAYQNIKRLKTAEDDAREVEAILRTRFGFQTKLLLNATRQQIISGLNGYRRELTPDASLIIYYAGHGVNDKEAEKAYWMPVDARLDDTANWISADDITTNIRVIPAKHVLIISDSCYSGTLTRAAEPNISEPVMRQRYLQKMMTGRSRTLMASGGNEPVADEGGNGHSIFASALLRGLAQLDKGQFTATELFRDFVEESVAGRVSQTPEYNPLRNSGHESGDFVFVRKGAAEQSVTVINNTTVNTAPPFSKIDPAAMELAFWDTIKNSTNPDDFKDYLNSYPTGQFASLARRRAGVAPGSSSAPSGAATNAAPQRVAPANTATNNTDAVRPPAGPSAPQAAKNDIWHYESGLRALKQGSYKDAEAAFRLAVQRGPKESYYHRGLGDALRAQKRFTEAEREYREAMRLNDHNAYNLIGLGQALEAQSRWAEAQTVYKDGVQRFPQSGFADRLAALLKKIGS